jgi:ABC-type amino acid transport substrate-binding protein
MRKKTRSGGGPKLAIRLASIAVAICALSLPGSPRQGRAAEPEKSAPQAKTSALRAGISTEYPPLAFKQKGRVAGIEADFAHRLPKELGTEVTIVEVPWNDLIPALLDHRIDVIMAGMSITRERRKRVAFTDPYMQVGQMAVIRKNDISRLHDPAAMDAKTSRVGYQKNTTGELFARENLKNAQLTGFESIDAGIAALRAEKIDFFVHDAPTVWRLTGGFGPQNADLMGLYRPLTVEYLAWAVRKEDEELRDSLNQVLERWGRDGFLESVLDKWLKVRKVTLEVRPSR